MNNQNKTLTLHYKGTFEDGTVFDSSYERNEAMTVNLGTGQLIEGFENAISAMTAGETKTFTIEPEQAYGVRDPERKATLSKEMFPDDFTFPPDMTIPLSGPDGGPVLSTLVEVTEESVVVDVNHPLAGKTLTFEVEVLNVGDTES